MSGKLLGLSSVTTLLLLIAGVMALLGWALEATDTTVHWGDGTPTLTGLSVCFEVPLLIVGFVLILWLIVLAKRKKPS
tara:strand:+ start:41 stop:274 length:234 start_codon:yes stop_codon:yes gene_type:complete